MCIYDSNLLEPNIKGAGGRGDGGKREGERVI